MLWAGSPLRDKARHEFRLQVAPPLVGHATGAGHLIAGEIFIFFGRRSHHEELSVAAASDFSTDVGLQALARSAGARHRF
jgi:hypothetical protein